FPPRHSPRTFFFIQFPKSRSQPWFIGFSGKGKFHLIYAPAPSSVLPCRDTSAPFPGHWTRRGISPNAQWIFLGSAEAGILPGTRNCVPALESTGRSKSVFRSAH